MVPRTAAATVLLAGLVSVACFPPGDGIAPPPERVYFPVGLAIDEEQRFLFIVNSDFDLQYNAGTVQSWDLEALRARVPKYCESDDDCENDPSGRTECDVGASNWCVASGGEPCGAFGDQAEREQSLYPGRCDYVDPVRPQDGGPSILPDDAVAARRAAIIGAFATDVIRRSRPDNVPDLDVKDTNGERLFIPVRGDASLHWIDVDDEGRFHCGQGDSAGACDERHRAGNNAGEENTRSDGELGPEPFGIDAEEDASTLLVTNQTSGAVGLFVHDRAEDGAIRWDDGPVFAFREAGLPSRPIGVANVPVPLARPASGRERLPGYLVSFRNAATVFLLRVYHDEGADPGRPYTRAYESQPILTNSSGVDSRGLAVDPFERKDVERNCLERHGISLACARTPDDPECAGALDATFQSCLEQAAAVPLDVFVANRAPSSVIRGRSQPRVSDLVTSDLPSFGNPVPLDLGPSRVYVGEIVNERGERERRIFVISFDSRRIAVYDPMRQRLETEIVTGRGPHALAVDIGDDHAYAYVAHFLDSYIGVVDLDQRHRGMYGAMIATIGKPTPPRSSK